jgi:hypothetical protein
MNGVKEKKDNKVLTYEELARSLKSESLSDAIKPITIKSTQLYTRVKELTEMAYPTQVNERDKRWNYFYVPLKYHGKNAVIPMSIMEYNSSYHIYFPSSESLKPLRVTEGNRQYRAVYDKAISGAAEFLPSLVDIKLLEEMVPYEFRTGKIKSKYIPRKERPIKESYFLVNRHGSEGISYRYVRPEYFAYIEWDPLEVVKPKAAFDKRE